MRARPHTVRLIQKIPIRTTIWKWKITRVISILTKTPSITRQRTWKPLGKWPRRARTNWPSHPPHRRQNEILYQPALFRRTLHHRLLLLGPSYLFLRILRNPLLRSHSNPKNTFTLQRNFHPTQHKKCFAHQSVRARRRPPPPYSSKRSTKRPALALALS